MDHKQKTAKNLKQANVLESLKDIGTGAAKSIKEDLIAKMPQDFMDQLFGPQKGSFSGEIIPGEAIEFNEVMTGKQDEEVKLHKEIAFERRLFKYESSFCVKLL